jgi:hypothetical protein
MLYSVKETATGSGTIIRQITIDERDANSLGTIIQRERKRANLLPLGESELIQLVSQLIERGTQHVERPIIKHQPLIDLIEFRNGVLKIAYEMAFLWLGESYIEDPTAATLRSVVLSGLEEKASGIAGWIDFGADRDPIAAWAKDKDCHIAFSCAVEGRICVCLKVFDVFSGVVFVTENSQRYLSGSYDPMHIRFIQIDPVAGTRRESSFLDETGKRFVSGLR